MEVKKKTSLIASLYVLVRFSVRALAILMVLVIIMGVIDVGWTMYQRLISPPVYILTISDMLATFGAFIAVLIAIEILINITAYLRNDVIQVKIVIATALMAIARKVIILDFDKVEASYVYAIGVVVVAMSAAYWTVHHLSSAGEDVTREDESE